MSSQIQLHEPSFNNKEITILKSCIKSGWVTVKGKYVDIFKSKIKKLTNSKYVVPTTNGTSALHVSLKLADVKKDDEVIVPTITYVATINPIAYVGASPIFMDVEDDLNISVKNLRKFLKEETTTRSN